MISLNLLVAVAIDLLSDLKREASTDTLSGLLNRRGFEAEASAAIARCQQDGLPVCVLIADLDHFKRVNDTYGHAVGDRVVSAFGDLIAAVRHPGMVTGRIGGEEFAILLPGASLAAGRRFAESLRTRLTATCAGRVPTTLRPTASLGRCQAAQGEDLYHLLNLADDALYEAKNTGRKKVCTAAPTVRDDALRARSAG